MVVAEGEHGGQEEVSFLRWKGGRVCTHVLCVCLCVKDSIEKETLIM